MSILWVRSAMMGFSKSLMPEKSLQVIQLCLVTWKDFSGIFDLEKPILALPPHRIFSFWQIQGHFLWIHQGFINFYLQYHPFLVFWLLWLLLFLFGLRFSGQLGNCSELWWNRCVVFLFVTSIVSARIDLVSTHRRTKNVSL